MYRRSTKRRQRLSQLTVLNAPRQREPTTELPTPEPEPELLLDSPGIESRHALWWRVHREEELGPNNRRWVLIGEYEQEEDALTFAARQRWLSKVSRLGSPRRQWLSGKRSKPSPSSPSAEPDAVPTPKAKPERG